MTIRELLSKGAKILEKAEVELPTLEAQLLLSFLLKQKKEYLIIHAKDQTTAFIEQKIYSIIMSRVKGKPISYITGKKEFFGLELEVNKQVLIPRPETELLLEEALLLYRKLDVSRTMFIDIGTGSGAIAVALAYHLPDIHGYAVDVSKPALSVAQKNIKKYKLKNIRLLRSDLLEDVPVIQEENIILLANLPYIPNQEIGSLPKSVRKFEPLRALQGGKEGLELYLKLFQQIPQKFSGKNVYLIFECDPGQINKLKKMIRFAFLDPDIRVYKDLSGKQRGGVVRVKV